MKHLDGLLALVSNEIGSVEQNGKFRSREEIDSVYKLIDIAKDIFCIWEYESKLDDDRYTYGAKRDRIGRYSRDTGYRNYSRGDAKQEYVDKLYDLMQNSPDDQTRQSIQHMIQQMEDSI